MQIILMCEHESGSAAFPAEWIEGIPAPERRYSIINHQVILDNGLADDILHHDADELLKNPLYRMPTPQEQEQMAQAVQQAGELQEGTGQSSTEQGAALESDSPPALENEPTTDPALKVVKQKKN